MIRMIRGVLCAAICGACERALFPGPYNCINVKNNDFCDYFGESKTNCLLFDYYTYYVSWNIRPRPYDEAYKYWNISFRPVKFVTEGGKRGKIF